MKKAIYSIWVLGALMLCATTLGSCKQDKPETEAKESEVVFNNETEQELIELRQLAEMDRREMENEYAELAEDLDVDEIDIEDFSDAILEKFAIAYNTEADKKTEAKDKEKQKDDDIAVKDKNGAGV